MDGNLTGGLERGGLLLMVAAIVAMLARRMRLPYTVGLVCAGLLLALTPLAANIHLTKELIFVVFLPPLVFEAAFYIEWQELKRDLTVILTYATVGVLISVGIVAAAMHFLAKWEWPAALIFGSLISATDPVSVIATFKSAGVHGRLRLLVEAESLFNDGTSVVVFGAVLAITTGGTLQFSTLSVSFLLTVFGGIGCGLLVGYGCLLLAGRTEDPLVELTFSSIAAYGSFLLAEHFHFSGVLATLTVGLLLGNVGSLGAITNKGRETLEVFWDYVAFVINSLLFLLVGIRLAFQRFDVVLIPLLIGIAAVPIARAFAVYPCGLVFAFLKLRVKAAHQHILWWGGLRGALSLALAGGLPADFPRAEEIRTVTYGVVVFSVIVQGLLMPPILRHFGEISSEPAPAEAGDSPE